LPDLVVKCSEGELSVEADAQGEGTRLCTLPEACLIRIEKFELALAGDTISIQSHEPDVADIVVELTERMLA
jgi:hypothetical protein